MKQEPNKSDITKAGFALFAAQIIFFYLLCAFVKANMNFLEWGEGARLAFAMLQFFMAFFIMVVWANIKTVD